MSSVGLRGERARDRDALALAAGELARVAVGEPRRQPHALEQLADLALGLARGQAAQQHARAARSDWRDRCGAG